MSWITEVSPLDCEVGALAGSGDERPSLQWCGTSAHNPLAADANVARHLPEIPMTQDLVRKHYRELFGEPSRLAEHTFKGVTIEIWKWDADRTAQGVALYATIGGSARPLPGSPPSHRCELFLGLRPPEDDVAMALAGAASYSFRGGKPLEPGHTLTFSDMPLWPSTAMRTFLVRRPREPIVPTLLSPSGLHVEFWQVLPLHEAELEFHRRHGSDALLEQWEALGVPFWDPQRGSAALPTG